MVFADPFGKLHIGMKNCDNEAVGAVQYKLLAPAVTLHSHPARRLLIPGCQMVSNIIEVDAKIRTASMQTGCVVPHAIGDVS